MKKLLIFILISIYPISLMAQSDDSYEEYMLGLKGMKLINEKKYDEAIETFNKALELNPDAIEYNYEKALAFTLSKRGDSAIAILENIIKHEDATDQMYQLLATNYVVSKRGADAVKLLREGIERFPNSGRLYMELAGTEHGQANLRQVLPLWEKGVEVDPNFPGNYYYLADYFSYTDERIWTLIYGEIYQNIATNSRKKKLMSQVMFNAFNFSVFTPDKDDDEGMVFTSIDIKTANPETFKGPFEWHVQQLLREAISKHLNSFIEIFNIDKINQIREEFIIFWYEKELGKRFSNKLFDYQRELIESGHNSAYGYWLYQYIDSDDITSWIENHTDEYNKFLQWRNANPLQFDLDNAIFRLNYK